MSVQIVKSDESLPLDLRRQVDAVCDRFEEAWGLGEAPDVAAFLAEVPDQAQGRLFRELLALDLEYRRAEGDEPKASEYHARFPERGDAIDAALGIDDCPDVSFSTFSDSEDDPWFEVPCLELATDADPFDTLAMAGYNVVEELGRGGMGVVYKATQIALNRSVALKVIKASGFATESERRRFRNEAEAVAQLDHPNIVPIYEVGQHQGLDYFSMKLIAGASLDKRLDDFRDHPKRAARVVAIAALAVHHAHERGILHRDLKPANILLDEQGNPHVTDFGLARRLEDDSQLTRSDALIGTPAYMSPEQVTGGKGALTTATDVYGLGTILYALLAGRTPHSGTSLVEMLDKVRQEEAAPPSKENRRVPRDLDIICLKCLEKDPRRRYPSALALSEEIERWLSGEPIAARPVGPIVRAWLWACRHPLPAILTASLLLALASGFAGITWKWREADRERIHFAAINKWADGLLAQSSTELHPHGANYTVLAMLDRAAARIGGQFHDQPEIEAAIRERVGRSYASLGKYTEAERHLRAALELDAALEGPEGRTTLSVANALTTALVDAGRLGEAEALARRTFDTCRRALGPDDPTTLDASNALGALLAKREKDAEAEPLLRQTLSTRRRVLPPDHPDTLRTTRDLCLLLLARGRFDEAEKLAYEYEHGIRCARGPNHPDNISALANRGLIRRNQGKLTEAEPFYRRALEEAERILGPDHPSTQAAAAELARVHRELAKVRPGASP